MGPEVGPVSQLSQCHCGTTTLTPELLSEEFHDHYHADIATMFEHESLAIMDFEMSIKHDITLLRSSPAVPQRIKLYGFFYESVPAS
jgi:carbonic anhydrase